MFLKSVLLICIFCVILVKEVTPAPVEDELAVAPITSEVEEPRPSRSVAAPDSDKTDVNVEAMPVLGDGSPVALSRMARSPLRRRDRDSYESEETPRHSQRNRGRGRAIAAKSPAKAPAKGRAKVPAKLRDGGGSGSCSSCSCGNC